MLSDELKNDIKDENNEDAQLTSDDTHKHEDEWDEDNHKHEYGLDEIPMSEKFVDKCGEEIRIF
jgi:hypothetical protein